MLFLCKTKDLNRLHLVLCFSELTNGADLAS